MKLSKKITLGCLLLNLVFFFGGFTSSSFSQTPSPETADKKAELDKQEKVKREQINKLKADFQEQQGKAADERKKCNQMIEEAKKIGKNPTNSKEMPITFTQCDIASSAEKQVAETKDNLNAAEQELATIQKEKNQLPFDSPKPINNNHQSSDSNVSGWLTVFIWVFGGFVVLAILLGGWHYFLSKKFIKIVKDVDYSLKRNGAKNKEMFAQYGGILNELKNTIKLQHQKIEDLQLKLREKDHNFKETVDELIQTVKLQQDKIEALEARMNKSERGLYK